MQRLLREVKARSEAFDDDEYDDAYISPPVLYLDCDRNNISSPQQFARALRELVTENTALKKWYKRLFKPAPDEEPLESIIHSLTTFFEAARSESKKPVLIIDEADVLVEWSDDEPSRGQLKKLLRFFVRVTNEERLGHIVLAFSEYSFLPFLQLEYLKLIEYTVEAIGDLATEEDAKKFVESRMRCGNSPSSFFDTTKDGKQIDMWPRVYEVCSGNIGLLERCASSAKELGSWEESINVEIEVAEDWVEVGLFPEIITEKHGYRSKAAWTQEDYKTVLREIAVAEKHAVSLKKLYNQIGPVAMSSMLEWNFVSLRVKSTWAHDLPEAVFDDLGAEQLVTMPSPACLYFAKKMNEAGELKAAPKNESQ